MSKEDTELLDWILENGIIHWESLDIRDREDIRLAMAADWRSEPCDGDPTKMERENLL